MTPDELLLAAGRSAAPLLGSVYTLEEGGEAGVIVAGEPPMRLRCHVLRTADRPTLTLSLGARVLVLPPPAGEEFGVVLGLVAPYESPRADEGLPAKLELAAEDAIELRVGQSSLTMTADGQVKLTGTDVTSRARRTQKIRGGTVHIN